MWSRPLCDVDFASKMHELLSPAAFRNGASALVADLMASGGAETCALTAHRGTTIVDLPVCYLWK